MRFLLLSLYLLGCLFSSAQYSFSGLVTDREKNLPMAGVTVSFGNKLIALTDLSGTFSFTADTSKALVSFSHTGFETYSKMMTANEHASIVLNRSSPYLSEVVVRAFEKNTSLQNIPVTVTVLTNADLERYAGTSILPAVNTVPGVKMDERSPGSYRLSIRGNLLRSPFGVRNVKVYWNGIPFTDANGNTYLNQLAFENVGKIEIIKGPGGSMYGAGTGGVVLLSSHDPLVNEHDLSLNFLAGSYGLAETGIAYRQNGDNASQALQYVHQQSDGWRDLTGTRKDVINYTGRFIVNKKQTFSTNLFYSDLYYQTPGGLTLVQLVANPRQSRPAGGAFKSAKQQQAALYIKTMYAAFSQEYRFNDNWNNTTSMYISHTRFRNPSILNYQRKTEQGIGGRTVTQYQKNNLTVHFGGEYQYGFTSTRTFGNQFGTPDTLQFDDEIQAVQYNLFLQTDISIAKDLVINAGISYNNYRYGFTRLNQRPMREVKKTFTPVFVPRISLLKKIRNYSLYASVSQGYSPPTIDEIVPSTGVFNPALAAEKGTNYEAGARGEIIKSKLFVEAAYYLFYLKNTIVTRRDAAGSDYFVNTGKTNQRGLEVSVNYYPVKSSNDFLREWKLWTNYTNIHARFATYGQGSNDYSGKKLTGTPPNVFILGTDIITKPGLYTSLTYSYTDMIPLNDANSFFGTQYNLFFGRVGYKKGLGKRIQGDFYFSFDRSFNEPYSLGNDLNAAGSRFFNPSSPQNFTVGAKFQFSL